MKQLLQNRAPRRWLVPGGGAATAGDGEGGGAVVGNLGFGGGRAPAPGFRQRSFVFPPLPILGWALLSGQSFQPRNFFLREFQPMMMKFKRLLYFLSFLKNKLWSAPSLSELKQRKHKTNFLDEFKKRNQVG